jgi:hypothetical protein
MKSTGSKITWIVPSRQGVFSSYGTFLLIGTVLEARAMVPDKDGRTVQAEGDAHIQSH